MDISFDLQWTVDKLSEASDKLVPLRDKIYEPETLSYEEVYRFIEAINAVDILTDMLKKDVENLKNTKKERRNWNPFKR